MKTNKPTNEAIHCFECEGGFLEPVLVDYKSELPGYGEFCISNVPMERCNRCGDTVIGEEGNLKIESYIDRLTKTISPAEIQQFFTKYGLTQRMASKITGYGEKNFSRWITGKSRPSESVSNFLKLLLVDEGAFERVRSKNWASDEMPSYPSLIEPPDTGEKQILSKVDYPKLVELGIVDSTRSPQDKRTNLCNFFRCSDLRQLERNASSVFETMAAFKDTSQKSNEVSCGIWAMLGERAATKVNTAPYDRSKLERSIKEIRELTKHPINRIIPKVQQILADSGVALVFVPIMKQSSLRGCTRLLSENKAMIIHSLKFRTLSQFWIILFHEIAHLLLHIETPEEVFAEYEDRLEDPREKEADEWAYDALFYSDHYRTFSARHKNPKHWELKRCAESLDIHVALVAEIFNKRRGSEVVSYAFLQKKGLFPNISEADRIEIYSTSQYQN